MLNVSGSMSFSSCRATKDGGAFTADSVYVEGSSAAPIFMAPGISKLERYRKVNHGPIEIIEAY